MNFFLVHAFPTNFIIFMHLASLVIRKMQATGSRQEKKMHCNNIYIYIYILLQCIYIIYIYILGIRNHVLIYIYIYIFV